MVRYQHLRRRYQRNHREENKILLNRHSHTFKKLTQLQWNSVHGGREKTEALADTMESNCRENLDAGLMPNQNGREHDPIQANFP